MYLVTYYDHRGETKTRMLEEEALKEWLVRLRNSNMFVVEVKRLTRPQIIESRAAGCLDPVHDR